MTRSTLKDGNGRAVKGIAISGENLTQKQVDIQANQLLHA